MALNGSGAKRLSSEFGGEREVHFAGALAEQLRFLGINAADQFVEQRAGATACRLQIALASPGRVRK